jgi:hypothetical protein
MRWTSFSSSAAAISATRSRRSSGVRTRHCFDDQLGKCLPQAIANMLGRGQIAAEHNGIRALLDQWRQCIDEGCKLRIGLWISSSAWATKARRAGSCQSRSWVRCPPRPRRRSPRRRSAAQAGRSRWTSGCAALRAAAGDEPTQRIRASVPQKARRRSAKPGSCARDDAEAVIEHRFLEIEMCLRQR